MKKLTTIILFLSTIIILFNNCSNDTDDLSAEKKIENTVHEGIEDELKELLEEVSSGELNCIEFIYPINLILYNDLNEEVGTINISSDDEFIEELTSLNTNYSLSISYPITGINENEEQFIVNNNSELVDAIKLCKQYLIIIECNNIMESTECVWKVSHVNNDGPDTYQNSIFRVGHDGLLEYYHNGEVYRGSWFFYFINENLHLNINMNDDDIGLNWSFDWKVIFFDDNFFEIKNNDNQFNFDSICPPCGELAFEECQIENTINTAIFNLNTYTSCIFNSENLVNTQDYNINFYELQSDAENATNEIITNLYTSTTETQTIYVRIENMINNTYITTEINLSIIVCN